MFIESLRSVKLTGGEYFLLLCVANVNKYMDTDRIFGYIVNFCTLHLVAFLPILKFKLSKVNSFGGKPTYMKTL